MFAYTVGAVGSGENTPSLALAASNAVALNGASITGPGGISADLAQANGYTLGGTIQVDTQPVGPLHGGSVAAEVTGIVDGQKTVGNGPWDLIALALRPAVSN